MFSGQQIGFIPTNAAAACPCRATTCCPIVPEAPGLAAGLSGPLSRRRRNYLVDPRFVAADRFKFRTQLGLVHTARSDDLQILIVAVEVRGDLQPDAIRIKK